MRIIQAIGEYFDALSRGDPIAVGFTLFFVVLALILGVVVWITKKRLDADDARWRKRRWY
ncbi:MAG: hypothetical protein L0241_17425 [Planctomycetia bacterium]|nr:hypothetical protein [Planctomycetia bacterium]